MWRVRGRLGTRFGCGGLGAEKGLTVDVEGKELAGGLGVDVEDQRDRVPIC
jgi:hypothetical protein